MTENPIAPTLIVDIGDTLLCRTQPGPFKRTFEALIQMGSCADTTVLRRIVADAVLTGAEKEAAAAIIARRLSLTKSQEANILRILAQPEGEAVIIPGAVHLLEIATLVGWRVVAATNASRWAAALPAPLAKHISATVSSSVVGYTKENEAFWHYIIESQHVDPLRSLVIGNDPECDVAAPGRAGFLSLLIDVGNQSVSTIAEWIHQAGPPPSELAVLFGGSAGKWGDRIILESPHLHSLVKSMTRRPMLIFDYTKPQHVTLIRRRNRTSVLLIDNDETALPQLGWLVPKSDSRSKHIPADFAAALELHGLSLTKLPDRDQRHLVSLVQEAKDSQTRGARIEAIVRHLSGSRTGA